MYNWSKYKLIFVLFKNIQESINNVPVHIGACDLKNIAFLALLPQISQWSKQYPLSPNNLRLREKNWVELIPSLVMGVSDVDAIARKFFVVKRTKGKGEGRVFQAGEITVYLELQFKEYQDVLDHIENPVDASLVGGQLWALFVMMNSITNTVVA
jgi:hypothetical protein